MTKERIIEELTNKGYKVESCIVTKNGIQLDGINFDFGSNVRPTIYIASYVDEVEHGKTVDDVVEEIINIVESNKNPNIDLEWLHDADNVLNNLYVAIQRCGSEAIAKRDTQYDGIEKYLYCRIGSDIEGMASFKVSEALLNNLHIDINYAWDVAMENTRKEVVVCGMSTMIGSMMGFDSPLDDSEEMMYVISNTSKVKGACGILFDDVIKELGHRKGVDKVAVLPSSIHECILVPLVDDSMDLQALTDMVQAVNGQEVSPLEQLGDRAYIVEC